MSGGNVNSGPVRTLAQAPLQVVVIDDQSDAGMLFLHMLEIRGHRVTLAEDGRSGVAAIERVEPKIAFVDLGLPDIDGGAVAARVRAALGKRVRLVAVTGFSDEGTRRAALSAGFDAYIVKPLRTQELDRELALATTQESPEQGPPRDALAP